MAAAINGVMAESEMTIHRRLSVIKRLKTFSTERSVKVMKISGWPISGNGSSGVSGSINKRGGGNMAAQNAAQKKPAAKAAGVKQRSALLKAGYRRHQRRKSHEKARSKKKSAKKRHQTGGKNGVAKIMSSAISWQWQWYQPNNHQQSWRYQLAIGVWRSASQLWRKAHLAIIWRQPAAALAKALALSASVSAGWPAAAYLACNGESYGLLHRIVIPAGYGESA
jgi:hypothetical protein